MANALGSFHRGTDNPALRNAAQDAGRGRAVHLGTTQVRRRKKHWQAAAVAVMMAAERNGSMMVAEITMREALLQANQGPQQEQRWSLKSLFIRRPRR